MDQPPQSSISPDHDLLIELRTEMRGMRVDINKVTESVTSSMTDHETRIRDLEKMTDGIPLLTKIVYGGVAIILIAFMGALVYQFIPRSSNINSVQTSITP